MSEQALDALDRAIAALTCDEIEVFPAGKVPLLRASIGFELVQIEKSFSGRGKTLLSATAAAIDEALLAVAEARQLLTAEPPAATTQPAPRKRSGGNLRGAPLFLRPSVVRGLIDGMTAATKGTKAVPVAPIRLVNMPRRSEDPRLAKANDDFAQSPTEMPSPAAPAAGQHEPGRVVPPVKPSVPAPEPATVNKAEPEGWPDAPLPDPTAPVEPETGDPDLDRTAPQEPALLSVRVIEVPEGSRLEMIRAAAAKLAKANADPARPSLGARGEARPVPLPALQPAIRRQRIEAAIAYLRPRGILVSVHDRLAQVRKYHVGGRRDAVLAEDVIALAVSHGMELPL